MHVLYLLKLGDSVMFLGEFSGGVVYFVYGSSLPLHGLLCFPVMSEIHLIIWGFQSPSAPSPTPASPLPSSS